MAFRDVFSCIFIGYWLLRTKIPKVNCLNLFMNSLKGFGTKTENCFIAQQWEWIWEWLFSSFISSKGKITFHKKGLRNVYTWKILSQ